MIAIIDYGAGNIRSVENAMKVLGQEAVLTSDPNVIEGAQRVILPGVGAFGDAMGRIRERGLEEVIRDVCERGTPFLGICLGLQLLFEESEESPGAKGLSILPGKIVRFPGNMPDAFADAVAGENTNQTASCPDPAGDRPRKEPGLCPPGRFLKVPEIGWNALTYPDNGNPKRLFAGVPEHSHVYFVHSYYLQAADPSIVAARSDYGIPFDASVECGNVFACQFHPEKSERIGMKMLTNFLSV